MLIDLFALDGLDQIGEIVGYSEASVTERDLDVGSWTVTVPMRDGNMSLLHDWRSAKYPGLEAVDRASGWRFGGFVTEMRLRSDSTGVTVGMGGVDFAGELQRRLHWPNPYSHEDMWQPETIPTRALTTAMHNLVAYHAGDLALEQRRIPNLAGVQGSDPAAGGDITAVAEGKPLLEVMAGWAAESDYTARLELFRTPSGGAFLYFYTPARYQANMLLTVDTGTVSHFEIKEQASTVETLIGTGAPIEGIVPEARAVQLNPRAYLTDDWRYRYSEGWRDFPSAGINELFTEMLGWRSETAAKTGYKVGGAQLKNFSSLSKGDVGIGWRVPVTLPLAGRATTLILPVRASTVTYDTDRGWERTAQLGDDVKTGQARVMQLLTDTARRVRRLEGG